MDCYILLRLLSVYHCDYEKKQKIFICDKFIVFTLKYMHIFENYSVSTWIILLTINTFILLVNTFSITETNISAHAFTSLSHYKNGKYKMIEKPSFWSHEAWHKGWHIEMTDNKEVIFFPCFPGFHLRHNMATIVPESCLLIFVGLIVGGVICIVNRKYPSEMEGIYFSYTCFHQQSLSQDILWPIILFFFLRIQASLCWML